MWLPYRVPYRWLPRTTWRNLSHIWYDLTHGPFNVLRWAKVIWFDADFDQTFLLDILEYKFRRMAESFETGKITRGWHNQSRQLRICQTLVHRLQEDNYVENAQIFFGDTRAATFEGIGVQKHDQEYLGQIIGKHLNTWWD